MPSPPPPPPAPPSAAAVVVYPWDALARPVPIAAVALLIANDHWLKHAGVLPGWLTGKLSDVAGLVFFPLLVLSLASAPLRLASARLAALTPARAAAACAATALLFSLAKTSQRFADQLCRIPGALGLPSRLVADPTDLLALPALWLAWREARRALAC